MSTDKLMTRKEVMTLLECSHTTLWKYIKSGKLPHYRAGRKIFFDRNELLTAIHKNSN
jgi:excisionase family DNA binding protein